MPHWRAVALTIGCNAKYKARSTNSLIRRRAFADLDFEEAEVWGAPLGRDVGQKDDARTVYLVRPDNGPYGGYVGGYITNTNVLNCSYFIYPKYWAEGPAYTAEQRTRISTLEALTPCVHRSSQHTAFAVAIVDDITYSLAL